MRIPLWSRRAAGLSALLGAVVVLPRAIPAPPYPGPMATSLPSYAEHGAALLGGVSHPQDVSSHMPLATTLFGLLYGRTDCRSWPRWRWPFLAILGILTWALGAELGSLQGAWLSVAVLAAAGASMRDGQSYVHAYYSLLVLLAGVFVVWRAQKPSLGRSAVLALMLGATLLYRSPLMLFGPALALFEWIKSRRPAFRQAAVLTFLPLVLLVPWLRLNWILHRQPILFEYNEASPNVVTGAVGQTLTSEGDWNWGDFLPATVPPNRADAVIAWAAGEVARHPLRYARAVLRRFAYAVSLNWFLWLLGAAGVLIHRRRTDFQELFLLVLYYLLIHCSMTVQAGYFMPLWPLLAALAGAGLVPSPAAKARPGLPEERLAFALACALFMACLALAFFTLQTVWVYGSEARGMAPDSDMALERALGRFPQDAWLLAQRGERRLDRGELRGALEDFDHSLTLRPDQPLIAAKRAWALMLEGSPKSLFFIGAQSAGNNGALEMDISILRAHGFFHTRHRSEAVAELKSALARLRPPEGGHRDSVLRAVREGMESAGLLLKSRPSKECLEVVEEFGELAGVPQGSRFCLAPRRQAALKLQGLGRYPQALPLFDEILQADRSAVSYSDRGLCRYLAGRGREAVLDLRAALKLQPDLAAALTLGTILTEQDRRGEALKVYNDALARTKPPWAGEALLIKTSRDALRR